MIKPPFGCDEILRPGVGDTETLAAIRHVHNETLIEYADEIAKMLPDEPRLDR